MIADIGFEIQTPTFNFMDYDPEDNSLVAYNIRFNKRLLEDPSIMVTLDNCTGVAKDQQVVPDHDLEISMGIRKIRIPVRPHSARCLSSSGVERCFFKDIYNDAEFHMVMDVEKPEETNPLKTILGSVQQAIRVWKTKVLDRVQIRNISAQKVFRTRRGRWTSQPFPFVYRQALVLPLGEENVYFFTPESTLTRENLTQHVFCNIQSTVRTTLRDCVLIMQTVTMGLMKIFSLLDAKDAQQVFTFSLVLRRVLDASKEGKYSEVEVVLAILLDYIWETREGRKSHPFLIRHSTYLLTNKLTRQEKENVMALLPSRIRSKVWERMMSMDDVQQRLDQSTVFKLEWARLDTEIFIEIRFLQYLISAELGNTKNVMLNSVQSLLDWKP